MRPQIQWSVAAVFAALLALPVIGQAPFSVDIVDQLQRGADTPLLFGCPSVRKEIKLTDEQAAKVRRIVNEAYAKYPRQPDKATKEARDQVNKAIPDILSAEQVKRLQQIKLQVNGVVPFTEPEVQQKLKLTDKQKEEMQGIADDLKKEIRKTILSSKGFKERVLSIRKVPQMRKEAVQKAVDKLSDEQKKTWNEMIGDTFEFPVEALR
jgi:hypothetical protein